ncbi:uncharacterized protein [Physcomitrium patens]|uniref:Uncharacterized protein n=2 Tax=Physcomitrium patens TaxID=3218 RepID=A9TWY4_PHYPA|nr:uncharacterized protein LOC112273976 isoform X1 [Physcomitrium patens]PNR31814.1 hypothetical protein PHYPA_025937 [Physcomitrium patens]|eukprot:XP_024358862.1 uncharacterized protein LOC112273976 isoform X1 [Physcomitrella patens]
MAGLDSRDGKSDLEGYSADNEETPGPTAMQKLKERVVDFENHLKGKESSDKEDPHPELSYIPPADPKQLQEGKQHGGLPAAVLGSDVPSGVTADYLSSVKDKGAGGHKKQFSGEDADEPTMIGRIKGKFLEAESYLKGEEAQAKKDPHPELSYITPMPQEKPGLFTRIEHKFGGQEKKGEAANPSAYPKGVGSSELGTGYEEDG